MGAACYLPRLSLRSIVIACSAVVMTGDESTDPSLQLHSLNITSVRSFIRSISVVFVSVLLGVDSI